MVTYTDPNLEEDIFDLSTDNSGSDVSNTVVTGDINRMPTTLPGSMLQMPDKPENIGPLDLTPANIDPNIPRPDIPAPIAPSSGFV